MCNDTLAALDFVAVPVFVIDVAADGHFRFVKLNRAHERSTGLRPDDFCGRTPHEVLPCRFADTIVANYRRAAEGAQPYTYEECLALPTGEEWWKTTLTPVLDVNGSVCRLIGTAINITEHKRNEIDAIQRVAEQENALLEIERMTSLAAHDLRTPMWHVSNLVRRLREDFTDLGNGKVELLEKLAALSEKASLLIDDVLSYAQCSRATENDDAFDVGHLLADLVAILDPDGRHDVVFPEGELRSDPLALQIILRNLLDNSFKHAGRAHLHCTIDLVASSPGWLTFTVADDGQGFADSAGAFGRLTERQYCRGFGLAGVKRLVEARGGRIALVQTDAGAGAVVRFTFPGHLPERCATDTSDRVPAPL
ncbi:MAG: PAS domain-containing sensor histidine kinase [Geminicoccaceae bacterium]|nr:PAS domain-containing sensor histidine kinase [Geminicoccaceae bacterium]